MSDLQETNDITSSVSAYSCPNQGCQDYGIKDKDNIVKCGHHGKDNRTYLYCRTCGKKITSSLAESYWVHISDEALQSIFHLAADGVSVRETASSLNISKETVNKVLLRMETQCADAFGELLRSLTLTESQLDELWLFIKKECYESFGTLESIAIGKNSPEEENGSGIGINYFW